MSNNRNLKDYKNQPSNSAFFGTFMGLAAGAVIGALGLKLYNDINEEDSKVSEKKVPINKISSKFMKQLSLENQNYIYDRASEEMKCMITLELMNEPMMLECGHTFDKDNLDAVLKKGSRDCPFCRKPINREPILNYSLRNIIHRHVDSCCKEITKNALNKK